MSDAAISQDVSVEAAVAWEQSVGVTPGRRVRVVLRLLPLKIYGKRPASVD